MDPIYNPYSPGAGSPPPELAGRDALVETARIALERTRLRFPTKSLMLCGLRGVGKTVLLDHIREQAEHSGIHTVRIEAPEQRSLPALLAPQLRQALLRLSRVEKARDLAQRGLRALAGFAGALKVKYEDIEVVWTWNPNPDWPTTATLSMTCRIFSMPPGPLRNPPAPRSRFLSMNCSMWRRSNLPP